MRAAESHAVYYSKPRFLRLSRAAAEKEKRRAEHRAQAKAHAVQAAKAKAAKDKAAAAVVPQLPAGPKVPGPQMRCHAGGTGFLCCIGSPSRSSRDRRPWISCMRTELVFDVRYQGSHSNAVGPCRLSGLLITRPITSHTRQRVAA